MPLHDEKKKERNQRIHLKSVTTAASWTSVINEYNDFLFSFVSVTKFI